MSAVAKRYFVRGRVQGVGFRQFVKRNAEKLDISGYARNLDDGRVEVYAVATPERHNQLAGLLWKGPAWSDVRGVEEQEAGLDRVAGFEIEA